MYRQFYYVHTMQLLREKLNSYFVKALKRRPAVIFNKLNNTGEYNYTR